MNATPSQPFEIKDCALLAVATGKKAQTAKELLTILRDIDSGCLYYHFWGDKLRPKFIDLEYFNDLAFWSYDSLNDPVLAERLAVLDPSTFQDLEILRQEIIDILEERIDEGARSVSVHSGQQFYFIRSQIVVFETAHTIETPGHLAEAIREMSLSSVFYHFIDARRRTPDRLDDFREWLSGFNGQYEDIIARIAGIDAYFTPLRAVRDALVEAFNGETTEGIT